MSSTPTSGSSGGLEARETPSRGLWGPLLGVLDACLSDALLRVPPDELVRRRMLVGSNLLLLGVNFLFLLYVPMMANSRSLGLVGGVCFVGFLGAQALLSWGRSFFLPAVLVCSFMTMGFALIALLVGEPRAGAHAVGLLIPILAVYLLGPRLGFIFAAIASLNAGFLLPFLSRSSEHHWMFSSSGAFFILGAWGLSWLITGARNEAHQVMERTARTLRESEGNLASLLENTDDVVCSLDSEGRLIAANSALKAMMKEYLGRPARVGQPLIDLSAPASLQARWHECYRRVMEGQRVRLEVSPSRSGQPRVLDLSFNPVFGEERRVVGMTLFGRDVTERKEAESKMSEMHRTLLDVSRQAGMAEIATGVLHNVGNALNSVNVSAGVISERLQGLRVAGLYRSVGLLREHAADLGTFLTEDERGRQLLTYLEALSAQLGEQREAMLTEMRTLTTSLEHIKSVVSMQQEHARFAGLVEQVEVPRLLDDALRLHGVSFARLGIQVRREYAEVPQVRLDRHKLLQILLNLMSNARNALLEGKQEEKRLTIRVDQMGVRLRIEVEDNGVGISPENQARLFTQGFTTRKDGHGFGLHISALAAAEMEGSLTCFSEGWGRGAKFIIDLPTGGGEPPAPGEEN